MLSPGDVVCADGVGDVRVVQRIGGGGQGEVFRAESPALGDVAVKWYTPVWSTEAQARVLDDLIERGAPDRHFLWPIARVTPPRGTAVAVREWGAFGYVMPLCEPEFVPLVRLVNGSLDPALDPGFTGILRMSQQLVESFRLLHLAGLCYRDISLANVFFDPRTANIRICDVDNVSVDDGSSKVLGTPLFMAPEIVRDTRFTTFPSRRTDLHSLAVLLFILLVMEHPLIGAKVDRGIWDDRHALLHFGQQPVFIFDPVDDSNRPIKPHVAKYWSLYPHFLRERMLKAFGEGLSTPSARVTEGEWLRTLRDLRDCMGTCSNCGATVFHDLNQSVPSLCHSCGTPLPRPLVLVVGKRRMVVSRHLRVGADVTSSLPTSGPPMAEVVAHPSIAGRYGLKNTTETRWDVTMPDGSAYAVGPRQAVELVDGMSVATPAASVMVRQL